MVVRSSLGSPGVGVAPADRPLYDVIVHNYQAIPAIMALANYDSVATARIDRHDPSKKTSRLQHSWFAVGQRSAVCYATLIRS